MLAGDIVIGLELGFSKISMVVGQINNFSQVEVISEANVLANIWSMKGILQEENLRKSIEEILDKVEELSSIQVASCYVTMPGMFFRVKQKEILIDVKNPLDKIIKEDIEKAKLGFENNYKIDEFDICSIFPKKFMLDTGKTVDDPIGENSTTLKMFAQIVYLQNNIKKKIVDIFKEFELEVDGFLPFALANQTLIFKRKTEQENNLVLDFFKDKIDFSLFINSYLIYVGTFPFGINEVNKLISETLGVSIQEAEKLRKKFPLAIKAYIKNDNKIKIIVGNNEQKIIKISEVVELIEKRLKQVFDYINECITKKGLKEYVKNVYLVGEDIISIMQSDTLALSSFEVPVKLAKKELLNAVQESNSLAYGTIKYVLLDKDAKPSTRFTYEEVKESALKRILEKIRNFFYS